jgi:superfamily II RNA helicase
MSRFNSKKSRRPQVARRRTSRKSRPSGRPPSAQPGPPRLHREAAKLLADIGKPEPAPFRPDPFQTEALERVLDVDVLVSAPTGSGKTWIAVEATREFLDRNRRVWYATPLKALSNSKYEEFGETFGTDRVGILTGDRKENADAPIIVGTTEILRNQLYDTMQAGSDLPVDLVILDEAHYLGDRDRGVVWEEVLIYLPDRVRLLLLSATISNADMLARWLTFVRDAPCEVVRSKERPVPLHVLFRTPEGELTPFIRGNRLFPRVSAFAEEGRRYRASRSSLLPDVNGIMETLRAFDLLPAIVFLKSRSDCDRALEALGPSPSSLEDDGFSETLERYLEPYPELQDHPQIRRLLTTRAGSHHAGQLPTWRLLVEKMMVLGYLEAIFSTSTVAAGVNFPARTVVVVQSDRFNGQTFLDMTATDLHQMTGRAGRRGMDKAGFTLIVPGRYMDVKLVKKLLLSEPEPLQSRIGVNFSMTLNLLLSHDPAGIRELLGLSFAAFREGVRRSHRVHKRLHKSFGRHLALLQELAYVDESGTPTYDGRWAARLRLDHPLLIAELIREGTLDRLDSRELPALIAPFVIDKDREIGVSRELWEATRPFWKRFRNIMKSLRPLMALMASRGFDVPTVMFWPAAAIFLWSGDVDWSTLTDHVEADEGDLAMLVLRTADHVRQLLALEDEQPKLADTARKTLELLVRSPLT